MADFAPPEVEALVRDALLHLYDVGYLQTHPLVPPDPASAHTALRGKRLMQALLDAVESLHPAPGTPTDSRAWRSYRLLELRYVECRSAGDVLGRLAISKTQYHREHTRALQAVASLLRDRWQLGEDAGAPAPSQATPRESLALREVEQLTDQMRPEFVDLAALLTHLLGLLRPVGEENRATLRSEEGLRPVYGDRVALRQVFFGVLNAALERAPGGTLEVRVSSDDRAVTVTVRAMPGIAVHVPPEHTEWASPEHEVARRLVEILGGELTIEAQARGMPWQARIVLPAAHRPLVLVVDNHPDFISLVARYLAEHDWRVVGAYDVGQAQELASECQPTVVLLDVMMPGQDGWDLLLALKSRPETAALPVIVCSVLYEPQVARALGAVAYLPKPVSQAALLEVLAPIAPGAPGPRASAPALTR